VKTSIVIPVHGKVELTRSCLEWLQRDVRDNPEIEVIVVDDGSADGTREAVDQVDGVALVTHDEPLGFAAACNDGAAEARGDYVLFLNNDTEGQDRWLDHLVSYADDHPEAAAVGAKLLYPNATIQHAGIVFSDDLLPRHVYRGFPKGHAAVSRSRPFRAVTAASMLIHRHAFAESGGFDVGFANGFEDIDLCLRLGATGHEIHYCAESVLVHDEAATRGDDADAFQRNADRYLERWRECVDPDELATYVKDGLLAIEPGEIYPLRLRVAPELAVVESDELEVFALLRTRAQQVFDLLKERAQSAAP
jgi:GT2 family glycosyltransferase